MEQEDVGEFYLYGKVHKSTGMADAGNPEIHVLDRMMDAEVRERLAALPVQFRSAVLLADMQGFPNKEITGILGSPVDTVRSRLFRERHLLQRRLWEFARDRHLITGR